MLDEPKVWWLHTYHTILLHLTQLSCSRLKCLYLTLTITFFCLLDRCAPCAIMSWWHSELTPFVCVSVTYWKTDSNSKFRDLIGRIWQSQFVLSFSFSNSSFERNRKLRTNHQLGPPWSVRSFLVVTIISRISWYWMCSRVISCGRSTDKLGQVPDTGSVCGAVRLPNDGLRSTAQTWFAGARWP